MSISEKVLEELRELKKSPGTTRKDKFYYFHKALDGLDVAVKFKDIDRYGIVVDYISLARTEPILDVEAINRRLEQQAETVQKTITYLLEDFMLIEMDKASKRAQLRSYPPYEKENSKFFYEIVLEEGTRVHFQRYEYNKEHRRYEKITSQLTLEIFKRLVDDLANLVK